MSDRVREPVLPRKPSPTGSERLTLPTATVASSVPTPDSTERRARSELLDGRHGKIFDGRHSLIAPALDTIFVMFEGSLWQYRAMRSASQPITEAGRLATDRSVDWDSWREEIRTHRASGKGNNGIAVEIDGNVLPSIEAESDPFTALQRAVKDSQMVINRELKARVHWEHEAHRLRVERDRARTICIELWNTGVEQENSEQEQLQTISSLRDSLRDTRDELQAANERRDSLQTELDRVNYQREQFELERNHFESERNRQWTQNRDLLAHQQSLRAQLTAAQALAAQPIVHQPPPINPAPIIPPPAIQPRVAAHPIGPVRGGRRGRARGARAARRGRGNATVVREQPRRACKVEKGYRT